VTLLALREYILRNWWNTIIHVVLVANALFAYRMVNIDCTGMHILICFREAHFRVVSLFGVFLILAVHTYMGANTLDMTSEHFALGRISFGNDVCLCGGIDWTSL
jgi:hypothetical protein